MSTMKALVMKGDRQASVVSDRPLPQLRPGYIMVKPVAVALNPTDWKHIAGLNRPGLLCGCDYAGIVEKTGTGYTKNWKVGDRISGIAHGGNSKQPEDGAFAEHIVVKADVQWRLPDQMSFEEGSTLGVGVVTCGQGLFQTLKLDLPTDRAQKKSEYVLIYGGSTATGALGIQFLKLAGYRVITICSAHNFDYVKSLGAEKAFNYNDADCGEQIRKYTNNHLKYAWDCIGVGDAIKICADALTSGPGAKYASLLPTKFPREDVESANTLAYSALGEPFDKGFAKSDGEAKDYEFQAKTWIPVVEKLLAEGKIKVHKPRVRSGIENILDGLDELRNNKGLVKSTFWQNLVDIEFHMKVDGLPQAQKKNVLTNDQHPTPIAPQASTCNRKAHPRHQSSPPNFLMPLRSNSIFACFRTARLAQRTVSTVFVTPSPAYFVSPLFRSGIVLSTRNMNTMINPLRDPNTLSNYNDWRTTHTTADFHVLFDEQRLKGRVSLDLKSITDAETKEIILDSSYLDISEVKINGQLSKWDLLPRLEPYGEALKIHLDKGVAHSQSISVSIDVSTTRSCTALQWLTPAQTSSKKQPYMFSQCQAIHARSIFPCQDTPDVKSTFDFNITSPLPVIASGLPDKSNPEPSASTDPKLYKFHQPVPIPSYLFALASGEISTSPIGPRSTVATDPLSLKSCTWELSSSTEDFIQAAESLIYPYAWHQYNVLVLPPSFPYGGMENPIYTFATPTIISGDRENIDVIAHELAHSWSGNLVSTCSWEHFWLNEGWTTYLERRIQAIIHGSDAWRDFSAIIGWKALSDSVAQFGEDHEFTKLVPDLKGKDPDDAFSSIPYEKGFNFLYFIEKLIGIDKFDTFIPHYFTVWKEKSLDSYEFKSTLLEFFARDASVSKKLSEGIDWDKWFYSPGFPPKPDFDTSLVEGVYALAGKWETLTRDAMGMGDVKRVAEQTLGARPGQELEKSKEAFEPSKSDIEGLTANQLVVFLERVLLFRHPLPASAAQKMGLLYGFTKSQNVELVSRYCQIAMKAGDETCLETVTELLGRVGRMKFVRPLYRGLIKVDRALAEETFEKNKHFYHPICRGMVEKILGNDA